MMSKLALALALGVSAHALSEREQMVNSINSIEGLTWKAGVSDKFRDVPLGASNRVHEARIADGGCSLRGSVNLNGYENAGDTATLVRRPP